MGIEVLSLPYQGSNILFLEEALLELGKDCISIKDILFRASEQKELERILKYGTDRGGFQGNKIWPYSSEIGKEIFHEDVIYATTEDEIRNGELDEQFMTTLKKFDIIENPLLLIYNGSQFGQVKFKQYSFKKPEEKLDSLLAVIKVDKFPEIQGWFSDKEGLFYRDLVKPIKEGVVVEVGCWKGKSTSYIGRLCNTNKTKLHCVDSWKGSTDEFDSGYQAMLRQEDVSAIFLKNMTDRGIRFILHKTHSLAASKEFEEGTVDLVFLDSSHDYKAVRTDIEVWFNKVKWGGILAGHDYAPEHNGLRYAVDEFSSEVESPVRRGEGSIWYIQK